MAKSVRRNEILCPHAWTAWSRNHCSFASEPQRMVCRGEPDLARTARGDWKANQWSNIVMDAHSSDTKARRIYKANYRAGHPECFKKGKIHSHHSWWMGPFISPAYERGSACRRSGTANPETRPIDYRFYRSPAVGIKWCPEIRTRLAGERRERGSGRPWTWAARPDIDRGRPF